MKQITFGRPFKKSNIVKSPKENQVLFEEFERNGETIVLPTFPNGQILSSEDVDFLIIHLVKMRQQCDEVKQDLSEIDLSFVYSVTNP